MATLESEVFDLFLGLAADYKLDTIFNSSGSTALNVYLEPWLKFSIDEFWICLQSLEFIPTSGATEGYFTADLTQQHKNILAQIMIQFWLQKEYQNSRQLMLIVQDSSAKTHSAAQNLTAKLQAYNSKREEISQLLSNYSYRYNDWASWRSQNFNGSS